MISSAADAASGIPQTAPAASEKEEDLIKERRSIKGFLKGYRG
jgi:hypothetical protein